MRRSNLLLLLCFLFSFHALADSPAETKPNVLFIMIDDLRVELGAYGAQHVQSPHIDALANSGTRFDKAYVSVPVCGASRASLATGMRPLPDRFRTYYSSVDKETPEAVTLFEHFKNNGYFTEGYGKIFHQMRDTEQRSWSAGKVWNWREVSRYKDYQLAENIAQVKATKKGPATEMFDGPDNAYLGGKLAEKTIKTMTKLAKKDQPFFLAVGFTKPHLPFNAPKKYWDLYDPSKFVLPYDTDNPNPRGNLPKGAPSTAYHNYGELRNGYSDTPQEGPVGKELARRLIHGYHAAVSYTDAQVGKILAKLDALGLRDNTVVVLMGDHGYILGEHGLWCKHSTFDLATRTPLIIRAPNMPAKQTVEGLVEFIDIFPTLTDLANISTPDQAVGMSLVKLLADDSVPAKPAVFTRYHAAEAIRTDQYTFTQWFWNNNQKGPRMLYDNVNDPNETQNLADMPEYKAVVKDLSGQLAAYMKTRK